MLRTTILFFILLITLPLSADDKKGIICKNCDGLEIGKITIESIDENVTAAEFEETNGAIIQEINIISPLQGTSRTNIYFIIFLILSSIFLFFLSLYLLKNKKKRVFISYRRADNPELSGRVYDYLARKIGRSYIFKDIYSIPAGVNFKCYIKEKIEESDFVLAMVGASWAGDDGEKINRDDDFVRLELSYAIRHNKPVIPLFLLGNNFPEESLLPEEIRGITKINGIDIRNDPDFLNDMDKLLAALKTKPS